VGVKKREEERKSKVTNHTQVLGGDRGVISLWPKGDQADHVNSEEEKKTSEGDHLQG